MARRPFRACRLDRLLLPARKRLSHLHFLREQGVPAYLVLVNFLNDPEMRGAPTSREVWDAAYQVAFHVMGLGARHRLSSYIIEVFPDVATAPM